MHCGWYIFCSWIMVGVVVALHSSSFRFQKKGCKEGVITFSLGRGYIRIYIYVWICFSQRPCLYYLSSKLVWMLFDSGELVCFASCVVSNWRHLSSIRPGFVFHENMPMHQRNQQKKVLDIFNLYFALRNYNNIMRFCMVLQQLHWCTRGHRHPSYPVNSYTWAVRSAPYCMNPKYAKHVKEELTILQTMNIIIPIDQSGYPLLSLFLRKTPTNFASMSIFNSQ